jgi:serine phosphatase RsbU (regulator of sigma subunit)
VRDENGQVENFVTQVADITAMVEANERNRVLAQQLQQQGERLTAELESAAAYMSSIMPRGLAGDVDVSSRYLPSRELGGDSFNYTWIDDDGAVSVTQLSTPAEPVGMFEDTEFTSAAYRVPPGCRILVHSDGASELDLADGTQLSLAGFRAVATRLAGSPDWTLDALVDELRALTPTGLFEDDCSLIRCAFD